MATASALRENGFDELAERYLRHLIDVPQADGPCALTDAQRGEGAFALGSLLAASGRWKESIPVNLQAARLAPRDSRPQVNLGAAFSQLNDWQSAIDHYAAALAIDPAKGHVLVNRGNAYLQLRQADAALSDFEAALALKPDDDPLRARCASLHFQRGHDREALAHFRNLLQRHPDSPEVIGTTAWLLATTADDALRNGAEALRLASRWCVATNHADPNALNTLAAAQAELGQFEAAVQSVTRALALARQQGLTALVAPLEARIKLYQSGKPFRR
jgi:tetratricopeptide (TPR) repeat protein